MKQNNNFIALNFFSIILSLILCACNPVINGEGPVVTIKKDANKFSEVDLKLDASVTVSQGLENAVVIHAQQNIADHIECKPINGVLKIYSDANLNPDNQVMIDITMNNIEGLELSGSGVIKSKDVLKTPELKLKISGSGTIYADVIGNKLESKISGSGQLNLRGNVTRTDYQISGSGTINSFDLTAQETDATITGSGEIHLTTISSLNAKITGSGSIKYKGNPAQFKQKVTGDGTIERVE